MPYWEQGRGDPLDQQLAKRLGTLEFNIPATQLTQRNRDELFNALDTLSSFTEMAACMWDCMVNEGQYAEEVGWALINAALSERMPGVTVEFDKDGTIEKIKVQDDAAFAMLEAVIEHSGDAGRSAAMRGYLDGKVLEDDRWMHISRRNNRGIRKLQKNLNKLVDTIKGPLKVAGKASGAATAVIAIGEGAIEASQACEEKCACGN